MLRKVSSWDKSNDTKIWLPLTCYHSPASSEGGPVHHRKQPFLSHGTRSSFLILMKIKYWAQLWVFQINGKWKALASMWGRKKRFFITIALFVQQPQTAGSPAVELLACIVSTFLRPNQIKIPLCTFWFGNASSSPNQAFEHTRLEKCNNTFPLCSVSWYFITQKLFPLILWSAEILLSNEKGKLWLLV